MKVSPIQRFIRWFGGSESGRLFDVFCVRWFSFSPIIWVFTKDDKSGYNNPCILTTVGRKSGLPRSTVLPVFPTGDGKLLVVGSRGGTSRDPHWAHNLRARPEAGALNPACHALRYCRCSRLRMWRVANFECSQRSVAHAPYT